MQFGVDESRSSSSTGGTSAKTEWGAHGLESFASLVQYDGEKLVSTLLLNGTALWMRGSHLTSPFL